MFELRGHGRDNFTKNLFKTFDTDKSGTIDFRYFLRSQNPLNPEEKVSCQDFHPCLQGVYACIGGDIPEDPRR